MRSCHVCGCSRSSVTVGLAPWSREETAHMHEWGKATVLSHVPVFESVSRPMIPKCVFLCQFLRSLLTSFFICFFLRFSIPLSRFVSVASLALTSFSRCILPFLSFCLSARLCLLLWLCISVVQPLFSLRLYSAVVKSSRYSRGRDN